MLESFAALKMTLSKMYAFGTNGTHRRIGHINDGHTYLL